MTCSPGLLGVGGGAEGDEQRRVVLDRRVRVGHARRLGPVVGQRVDVAAAHRVGGPGVEVGRPAGSGGVDAELGEERQAVGEEAGADDQHALVAQRPQPLAQLEEAGRVGRRERHLEHRDVAGGVHDLERDPGAVVQAAAGVLVHRLAGRHHRRDPLRERRGVGGLVRHLVVPRGEAAEVVDQRGAVGAEHHRRRLPVRADDEDRRRARQVRGPLGQLAGPERVVEQGRGAVADVEGRHAVVHVTHDSSTFNFPVTTSRRAVHPAPRAAG